ncbi:MAG: hypothetical protein L6R38_006254 [Xanthoria sp. 2 TBL-2021]|nr:MAG: hypothetical protein L6R38_006254 [Xanthoria sp. 2 TBL-2021]
MSLPLAVALPAILASGAYFDARTHLSYDLKNIFDLLQSKAYAALSESRDRANLFYELERHAFASRTANHPFLVYQGTTWTFRETYDTVLKYGTWMKTRYNVAPKEVVAVVSMNCPEFVFLMLGLWSIGAHPALINYNLTGAPLIHCLTISTARVVFIDEEISGQFNQDVIAAISSPTLRDGKGPMERVTFNSTTVSEISSSVTGIREPDSARSGAQKHHMAALIYTSGTTGLPKAAIVSWGKIRIGGDFVSRFLKLTGRDRYYTCMPLYHSTATILGFGTCLLSGITLVLGHRFSNCTFWPEVRDSQATVIQYVGETLRYLLAAPPQTDPTTGEDLDKRNKVRLAFGNGLRPDVWKRFQDRFGVEGIGEFYSATEGTSGLWNLSRNDFAVGAIGRSGLLSSALFHFKSAIVQLDWESELPFRNPDKQNFCTRVPQGEPGELLFKVDAAAIERGYQGYFNNAKASNSKIMRSVFAKGDAYFRTGDVVRWDKEGRWWFCDRIGDTFRWKSENVSTAEVSEVLGMHPAIGEANVYGVELPHHEGRAGCATIMFHDGTDQSQKLFDGIALHVKAKLPRYAVPIFLRVTQEMQATGNNKQQKQLLRTQGVNPEKIGDSGDQLLWLHGGTYMKFDENEWKTLEAGRVKL